LSLRGLSDPDRPLILPSCHSGEEAECLEIAQDIRIVLCELGESAARARRDDTAVKDAVSRLQARHRDRKAGAAKDAEVAGNEQDRGDTI